MKTVFIISGFDIHETASSPECELLRKNIAAKGYKVIPVDISWRQTTPSQYTKMFVDFYNKTKSSEENIVIGNSFGAVVALLATTMISPDLVMLCSVSPFFEEDVDAHWPPQSLINIFGKRRFADLRSYSSTNLVNKLDKSGIQFKVLYGEKEHQTSPRLVKRTAAIANGIRGAKLIEIPNAPHSFESPEYAEGIINEL